jgi:hypothetical protein
MADPNCAYAREGEAAYTAEAFPCVVRNARNAELTGDTAAKRRPAGGAEPRAFRRHRWPSVDFVTIMVVADSADKATLKRSLKTPYPGLSLDMTLRR